MSKKLIEFLVHFSNFYYNVIACFYAEICTIYQIYILQKFIAEMKILARVKSESSLMAKVRPRQRIKVTTRSHTILNEKLLRQKRSCRDRKRASRKDFMSRHHSKVTTLKEDNSGCNR